MTDPVAPAEPVACPDCDAALVAVAPMAHTNKPALIEADDPAGDLLVVTVAGRWVVRRLIPGERVHPSRRRREHRCPVYAYPGACSAASAGDNSPYCGQPARLYPRGWRCRQHQP